MRNIKRMGKRSDFERVERDFYPTPYEAVLPLVDHLPETFSFVEPCAGDGRLINHLKVHGGICTWASDIEPQADFVLKADALEVEPQVADCVITNPPWNRKILHPMIEHFSDRIPTWLLFDADWMHTKQSVQFIPRLKRVVSIGRVKWIEGSKSTGKDNCCWYLFDKPNGIPTQFFGRK
jgi:hypothetical protein